MNSFNFRQSLSESTIRSIVPSSRYIALEGLDRGRLAGFPKTDCVWSIAISHRHVKQGSIVLDALSCHRNVFGIQFYADVVPA
jgi:hypothetical protein